jgi:hypothetical protein
MLYLKHYEEKGFKTFYFAKPIFVELLHTMGRPHKFLQIFIKCLSALIKSWKCYWI